MSVKSTRALRKMVLQLPSGSSFLHLTQTPHKNLDPVHSGEQEPYSVRLEEKLLQGARTALVASLISHLLDERKLGLEVQEVAYGGRPLAPLGRGSCLEIPGA